MSNPDLYRELLAEADRREAAIEKARQEFERAHERDKIAAQELRKAAAHVKPFLEQAARPTSPRTRVALQEPIFPEVTSQPTFIDIVASAIKEIDSPITTAGVFATLSAKDVPMGDDPRTKISTVLSRLEKRGALVKETEGGMGRAHAYRKAK